MTGPTRPRPLSLNAILVIAGLCATASVLVVPKASVDASPLAVASTAGPASPLTDGRRVPAALPGLDQAAVSRDLTAHLKAIGAEASIIFTAVDEVAGVLTH